MATTDPIADLLTRVRNGSKAGHPTVTVPASKAKERILEVLQKEGYIDRVEKIKDRAGHPAIRVFLRYLEDGRPVIREMKRLSRCGRRMYVDRGSIPQIRSGLGTVIVSTSKGVMSDREARKEGVGGELICSIF